VTSLHIKKSLKNQFLAVTKTLKTNTDLNILVKFLEQLFSKPYLGATESAKTLFL
jgi:hypothetical protein